MSSNKRGRNLKCKNQLEEAGCIAGGENTKIYSTDMTALANYMRDIDSQQYMQRYAWKVTRNGKEVSGWSKSIPAFRVEQILYFKGSGVLFKLGKDFMFLPYAITKGYNAIGLPNSVKPISFNGEYPEKEGDELDFDLIIKNNGTVNENANAVILYDRYNAFGRANLVGRYMTSLPIIQQICNRFAYLGINIKNSQGKYIIICKDEKSARVIEEQLDEMFNSTKNFTLIRAMFDIQIEFNKSDYQEQQIWEDIASWNSLRCEGLGIQNDGLFNKKERKLSGELSGSRQQSSAILDNGLRARQEFVEQVLELWGDDPDFKEQFGDTFECTLSETYQDEGSGEELEQDEEGGEDNGDDTNILL